MRFEDEILKSYNPRFDDFFKDLDRYAEQLFDLMQAKKVPVQGGKTIFTSGYYEKGRDWLIDYYISEAQYVGLEGAILSNIDSEQEAEIKGYQRVAVDKLAGANQVSRGARIWRQHVASHVSTFWTFWDARQRHQKQQKLSAEGQKAQSRLQADLSKYDHQMASKVPQYKSMALAAIAAYRNWLVTWGIPDRDQPQLVIWEDEVQNEQRAKLSSPNKTPMDEDLFWTIVETGDEVPTPEKILAVETRLAEFTPKAIREFGKILRSKLSEAYRSDMWALAYLLMNGASDDAFEVFRCWLILSGRETYGSALSDPNSFDIGLFPNGGNEFALDLIGIPEAAYNRRSKSPMKITRPKAAKLEGPALSEEDFPAALPRIAKLTSQMA